MNILFVNNCERYHSGSAEVTKFFKEEFKNHNMIILKSFKRLFKYDLKTFDVIIANGEGTMHDNAPKALEILNLLSEGKKLGVKTLLVNSVWQNNSIETTELLNYVDYVSVREIASKNEIQKIIKKDIDVNLDVSYFTDVDDVGTIANYNIVAGNRYADGQKPKIVGIGEDFNIDIFSQSWEYIVNNLKKSKILVTGRHHEMYAACKAKCPFIVLEGNTHKNSGFLKTLNSNIPTLSTDASTEEIIKIIKDIDKFSEEYLKLFSSLDAIKKPNFLKNAGLV